MYCIKIVRADKNKETVFVLFTNLLRTGQWIPSYVGVVKVISCMISTGKESSLTFVNVNM